MRRSTRLTLTLVAAVLAVVMLAEWRAHAQASTSYAPPNAGLPNPYQDPVPFPKLPNGRKLGFFTGMTVDAGDHVWFFARGAKPDEDAVIELDTSGNVIKSWGRNFNNPHNLDIDKDGNVWLVDGGIKNGTGSQVYKYSPDGKLLMSIGKAGVAGNGPDEFNEPNAVKVAKNGDIFVASGHKFPTCQDSRIQKFSKDGKFIKEFAKQGSGPAGVTCPHQMAFDSKGRLYVAELGSNFRISIFDQDGKFIDGWKQFGSVTGVYIDGHDMIYGTDSISTDDHLMNKNAPDHGYNPGVKRGIRIASVKDGKITAFIPDPNPPGPVHGRETVAVDHEGNIYQGPDNAGTKFNPEVKKYVKKPAGS